MPRLERLLPEPQGRQLRRSLGRGNPVRRRGARGLERQGPAVHGQELRVRGQDQRAALGAVLQPLATSVRRGDAGVPAHQRRQAPAPRPAHQRRVTDRSDAEGADRPATASRRSGRTPRWTISSSRTAASSARASPETARRSTSRREREFCSRRGASAATRTCAAATAATSPTRRSGRSPTRATPARCCRRRCAGREDRSAGRGLVAANRFSSPTPAPRRSGPARQRPGAIYVDGDRQAVLQRVELLRRSRQGDVRQQGGAVLADLRRGLRRQIRVRRQPVPEAQVVRRADRAGRRQARRHDRRAGAPDRCSRRSVGADGQALQRVRGQGPRPRLRARPVGVQRSAWAIPGTSRTPRSARSTGRRTTPPGVPGRRRHLRGSDHQRARPGARRAGPGDRRSLCDGQHHRDGDGPQLSGCGRRASPTR